MASDLRTRVREGWQDTLRGILEKARSLGSRAVLAFDRRAFTAFITHVGHGQVTKR